MGHLDCLSAFYFPDSFWFTHLAWYYRKILGDLGVHCLSLVDPEGAVSGHGEPVSYLDAFKFGLWNLWIVNRERLYWRIFLFFLRDHYKNVLLAVCIIHYMTRFDFRGVQCFQVMCVVSISVHILHKYVIYEVTKHGNIFSPVIKAWKADHFYFEGRVLKIHWESC